MDLHHLIMKTKKEDLFYYYCKQLLIQVSPHPLVTPQ